MSILTFLQLFAVSGLSYRSFPDLSGFPLYDKSTFFFSHTAVLDFFISCPSFFVFPCVARNSSQMFCSRALCTAICSLHSCILVYMLCELASLNLHLQFSCSFGNVQSFLSARVFYFIWSFVKNSCVMCKFVVLDLVS